MTASAPESAASLASAIAAAGVDEGTAATNGTRPPGEPTTGSTTARRSAPESDPASPIVPLATSPWTPASSSAARFASSAARSISPSAPNGVVTAGMMPSKRIWILSVEGHVPAHAPEVLGGVELRGGAVALGDRLVDHPVLGRVQPGAPGG